MLYDVMNVRLSHMGAIHSCSMYTVQSGVLKDTRGYIPRNNPAEALWKKGKLFDILRRL